MDESTLNWLDDEVNAFLIAGGSQEDYVAFFNEQVAIFWAQQEEEEF